MVFLHAHTCSISLLLLSLHPKGKAFSLAQREAKLIYIEAKPSFIKEWTRWMGTETKMPSKGEERRFVWRPGEAWGVQRKCTLQETGDCDGAAPWIPSGDTCTRQNLNYILTFVDWLCFIFCGAILKWTQGLLGLWDLCRLSLWI